MESAQALTVEVVLFGFADPRFGKTIPVGFALLAGNTLRVHHRSDIEQLDLPPVFKFTLRSLSDIILDECRALSGDLHPHLQRRVFDCVGSFRCWQPIKQEVDPGDLDLLVMNVKDLVNGKISDYKEESDQYRESCTPAWSRSPSPAIPLSIPDVPAA